MAELEPLPIGDDQDPFDRPGQRPGHHLRGLPAGRRQDLPVEVMPHHCRRLQDRALAAGKLGQPAPHRVADRLRDAGRGQELLDEQRHALRRPPHPGSHIGACARGARGDHLRHLAVSEAAEREMHDARPSPLPPGQVRCRGRRLRPKGDSEQHRLAGGVVSQVLDQRHRIRVRPVQILHRDHQPIRLQAAQQLQHRLPPEGLRVHPAARVSRPDPDH